MKTFKEFLSEANSITVTVDWAPDTRKESGLINNAKDSLGVKIKMMNGGKAELSGEKSDLIKILKHKAYMNMSDEEVKAVI